MDPQGLSRFDLRTVKKLAGIYGANVRFFISCWGTKMNDAVKIMIERYRCQSVNDYENALKEIIQEIALLGLWRSKFYEKAAFYGGSALRILYGLDRFSEDLDFSLLKKDKNFVFENYCRD